MCERERERSTHTAKQNKAKQNKSTKLAGMGVAGDFLPRVLESTGRIVDLRDYCDGVLLPETAFGRTNKKSKSNPRGDEHDRRRRRRPLRIGIDVSAWIYRAGFAFGDRLMHDDRHLTSYGRANLQKEQQNPQNHHQQQQQQQKKQNQPNTTENSNIITDTEAEKLRDYCEACANYVVRRLELLKQGSGADLLVVFDGRTPPIKTATVSHRKQSREFYQKLRDDNNHHPGGIANANAMHNNDMNSNNGEGGGALESWETTRNMNAATTGNTSTTTTTNTIRGLDVEADIEQRVKANRRAGPGEHVPRIVDAIIEKLRQKAAAKKSVGGFREGTTTTNNNAQGKNGEQDPSQNNIVGDEYYLAAWMVAPYEADSQLAYLSKQSYIDLVITEDTDLIAHGCRSVMYKCIENHTGGDSNTNNNNGDRDTGEIHIDITRGKLVEFQDLGGTRVFSGGGPSKPDLTDFTPVMMAVLFVLLGCDYNGHRKLKGIGILRACKIVRKAFLESSSNEPEAETTKPSREGGHNSSSSSAQEEGGGSMIPFSPQYANTNTKSLSCLDIVWKEAYEQSYESNNYYTEDFKREYQKSFVEALWMYRHPIVFDPMIRACIQSPSPVSWNDENDDANNSNNNNHDNRMGDPELMDGCQEYLDLCSNPIRIMQVVGELPPTQEESISIAEGRSHSQWKLRKPTPIYSNSPKSPINNNYNTANHKDQHPSKSPATASARSRKKRRATTPSSSPNKKQRKKQEGTIALKPASSRRKRTATAAAPNDDNTSGTNRNGSHPGAQTGESSSSPAFRSRRAKTSNNNNNNKRTLETYIDEDPPLTRISSTKSDRRRSLDNDEIAAIAAGGIKKGDRRPGSMVGRDNSEDKRNEDGRIMSRNLFSKETCGVDDDDTNEKNTHWEKTPSPRQKPPSMGQPSSSVQSYESGETVPLSATPGKGFGSFFNSNADETEVDEAERSPNLLASTTPESGKGRTSTQSSSKATLSLSASGRDTIGGTGTQSSSKATTQTLSPSQRTTQTQSQSQSSSKATPKTPSSPKSVDLLASSATSTRSNGFTTPLQLQSQFQTPSQSQSQSPHFSTQEELPSKVLLLGSQSPLIVDDAGETKMLTQEEDIVEKKTFDETVHP
jgi:5'-3' exonuclease